METQTHTNAVCSTRRQFLLDTVDFVRTEWGLTVESGTSLTGHWVEVLDPNGTYETFPEMRIETSANGAVTLTCCHTGYKQSFQQPWDELLARDIQRALWKYVTEYVAQKRQSPGHADARRRVQILISDEEAKDRVRGILREAFHMYRTRVHSASYVLAEARDQVSDEILDMYGPITYAPELRPRMMARDALLEWYAPVVQELGRILVLDEGIREQGTNYLNVWRWDKDTSSWNATYDTKTTAWKAIDLGIIKQGHQWAPGEYVRVRSQIRRMVD